MVIAPMNATIKHPQKISGDVGIDFRDTRKATNAAQKGDKFMMVAVMIGLPPLKPILYSNNPATPIRNRAASLPIFPASNSTAAKSRRAFLAPDQEGNGGEQGHLR